MSKIQDKNRYYFFLRRYVDFMFKAAYRRVEYHGKEKIPQNAAIIYAFNHSNTMMDALVILAIDRQAKVFVSRADIFKHPIARKFFTFLKMLPINRKRDGMENLAKNNEVNEIVIDVLRNKIPFCISPEGTHRAKHSLMPLQKGIFRIALQANDAFGNEIPVFIVPVGIEFGHYFRFRSSLLVQIGEPINITKFVNENPNLNVPQQINALRDELTNQLQKVMLQIPDDENYNATLELAEMNGNCLLLDGCCLNRKSLNNKQQTASNKRTLLNRFISAKETIKNIENSLKSNQNSLERDKGLKTQELLDMAGDFSETRHTLGIGMSSVVKTNICLSIIWEKLLLLLGFPCFVFSAIATSPVTLLSIFVCSKFKDRAWHNSIKYLLSGILLPIFLLLFGSIITFVFSWKWGVVFAILFIPSFYFLHEYLRLIRIFVSDIKWLKNNDLRKLFLKMKNVECRM